ncbi:MAG: crotonase/enoyl-CoA hydratase family protein [Euryhalocaulis sp.]|uniref:crotonase/enoyl-CoA hydratase family protein n=1 Tax=Euryhalocaulis sp. TaxID=2744307 RepID=UPI0017E72762|nr:crotonase/enoyl-CoA hydratase family protein [Euryhalocaulis sp.]MBA4800948.1 crotonase/enoyl-CoA hydratase family protein [Euryhalocaulis sp.]
MTAPVILTRDKNIAAVSINRPAARNAVDAATANELRKAFLSLEHDADIRVIVFTGEGGAFCAGWDLKTVSRDTGLDIAPPTGEALDPGGPMGPTRLQLSKPVIAAIEGPAVAGGMELALWCDLRVMAKSAYLGIYNRRWGVPLIDGGTTRLPRLIGESRAMDLILTGRKMDAEEAFAIGLANRLTEDGAALETALELARQIAAYPPNGMLADWKSAREGLDGDMMGALEREFARGAEVIRSGESAMGAGRFASGKGRGGDFGDI